MVFECSFSGGDEDVVWCADGMRLEIGAGCWLIR